MKYARMTVFSVTTLVVFCLLASIRPAHAYIDPGTGAYLFQTVLALVVGCIFFMRQQLGKLRVMVIKQLQREDK